MRLFGTPDPKHLTVTADLSGGTLEAIKLTDNHVKKLLLRAKKNGVLVEVGLSPAAATDFADELQGVLDWLGDADAV